ncbi:disintegrin and metalloproteinase domain-containing protein 21-like [Balaenoptera ricei]|uniref:disintegrin and metalloproteinase domain-containing protein 21-like n=1 Tax=Balaenoptera ricei TaxID=2746895 RepID=UPI0028BD6588|nr:disintegrin and metalloproteinase domain-containing protein 21-like [Balaenoptera ricei]XP_059763061.1 disintegrin and metalloproteinase domain-containing protein 21-like [Balaenoptera ricei]XP_059763062.1 disintegrin and metalloproteinase domain-containing protein 21-like [Balaenoptera ricei]XP_059763063.1 disintegrin and metalloproteinase domain-containing protein 21-like [Balaenoptera ricei]XP_059763064.1 disintegrin and metalloproteinase domain-containing protein 21-like [Balaenoptera ri
MSLSKAPRLAEGQVTLGAAVLLLGLWAVLAPVQCSQGRPSWRYISSELVIPRKELHRGKGVQTPGWLSYSLHFGGQRHVIHMRRKKLFWPGHLLLMTQDDQGALQMDYPFVPSDCYYLGYLEEIPFSMVTVDTCYGGLEGIMKLDDLAYEIKPLKDSERFEHVVSQIVADASATGPAYGPGHKEVRHPLFPEADVSVAPRSGARVFAAHKGIMKGFVQYSNSMYHVYNNVSKCVETLVHMCSIVDSFQQGLAVRFYLVAVVLFNERDPTVMNDYRVPGGAYARYHANNFRLVTETTSSLIVIRDGPRPGQFEPETYTMCTTDRSLLFVGYLGRHYLILAIVSTQLIGRSFGLWYDGDNCYCMRRSTCLMAKYPALTDAFSDCSIGHWWNIVGLRGSCIFNTTVSYFNESLIKMRCGNYIVEDWEQCDCGSFKQCYSNKCCEYDCMLEEGATCNEGLCCTNCTYSEPGTLCRPIQNPCDLPEYCFGTTSQCPEDFYMQDGTPCTEEGYCYHGNCTDRTMHCREIFGRHAINAHDVCYTINRKANRFGHCTRNDRVLNYAACGEEDIKCGRLQCSNVTHVPRLQEHVSFHQSKISGVWCWGVGSHYSPETTDVGHVRSGTPCAPERFCLNSACNARIDAITYDCPPKKCNHRGICNNRRNCHCHVGWEPPLCLKRGPGGSMDSGPSSRRIRSVKTSQASILYLKLVFGRIYTFIAALLFGVATNVKNVKTSRVKEVIVGDK